MLIVIWLNINDENYSLSPPEQCNLNISVSLSRFTFSSNKISEKKRKFKYVTKDLIVKYTW